MELRTGPLALALRGTKSWLHWFLCVIGSQAVGDLPQFANLLILCPWKVMGVFWWKECRTRNQNPWLYTHWLLGPFRSHFQPQLPHPQNEVPPTCLPVFEVVRDPTRSCTLGLLLYGSWGECKNGWGCAWNSLWPELRGNKKHKLFLPHWNTIADLFNAHIFNTFQHILSPKQWFPCQTQMTIVYLPQFRTI